ncbi:AAA family ATPase [Pseudonocardia kujensis]|uniref:ATP-dependent nuclease n=1 Tax=Pseudonocardia kujensis TaxID=1128675 RepID=UPI001E432338|nr:AAA family ATPase [Pseudonocardia kujensis]MCE0764608.1 AAA family ATPase [Pseudonocardia kujensis]
MRISRLSVRNHSRLKDFEIEVRSHLVLVGPNDVGKSSVLRCVDLLLGASTAQLYQQITSSDFRDAGETLVIEADLVDFQESDKANFPDEIQVIAETGASLLTLRLAASIDEDQTITVERTAPGGGTGRQVSRSQMASIGWKKLGATVQARDLRGDRKNIFHEILQAVDLGDELDGFTTLTSQLKDMLEASNVLEGLRGDLAGHLSKALPEEIRKEDLALVPGATAENDVLNDVRLQIVRDGTNRDISDQSDGTKALFAIAFYDLASQGANVVAIDEPEIHLHPTSQRSLARLLVNSPNQKILSTHSTDIVGSFDPECIVAVRAGGALVQPQSGFLTKEERVVVEWWVHDKLEPLTSLRVIAVEGISDRIILQRVAELTDRNLDRLGISILETGGAGNMGAIMKVFGKSGFDIPLSILIDDDAKADTASKLGVEEAYLKNNSVWISNPDLEGEYVEAFGAANEPFSVAARWWRGDTPTTVS